MIYENELATWWASLPVYQKERIARKGLKKAGKTDEELVRYPACTSWWISLSEEKQLAIHDNCVDKHGYLVPEWNEADPYGD